MNTSLSNDGRTRRPSVFPGAFAEFIVICGASLAAIFVLIPNQTTPGDEIGLSPSLVPTVCAAAIGVLGFAQFVWSAVFRRTAAVTRREPLRYALFLMASALVALVAVRFAGLLVGCTVLALLVSLVLGERRLIRLALVCGGVALALFTVQYMGF